MVIRSVISKFCILFLSLLCCGPAFAEETKATDKVVIVLDASGSMWGQIKSKPKIDIAKEVVKDLLTDWDTTIELGLTAYGHRRKADCEDIQTLVPVGALQKETFVASIDALKPVGKTPLTEAVRRAAQELKYNEDRATVILVSDGIETCGQDPCKVAEELEGTGVDFTTHVVGFGISSKEEIAQLTCIAEKTGGKYLSAEDAGSLKSSLDAAVKEVAKAETGVELIAVTEVGGKPLPDVRWKIYQLPKDGEEDPKYLRSAGGSTPTLKLEPGAYRVEVISNKGQATGQKDIEIAADRMQSEEVIIAAEGEIELVAVTQAGGEPLEDMYWQVVSIPSGEMEKRKVIKSGKGSTPTYRMLPGKYLAIVKSSKGKAGAEQEIEVVANKKNQQEVIIAKEGVIKLIAVTEAGGKPLSNMYWQVRSIPDSEMEKPKLVTSGRGPTPEYRLLPGRYTAKVKSNQGVATAEQEVEVIAGKRLTQEVIIAREGIIELSAVHASGGKPLDAVYWEIFTILPEDSMDKPKRVTSGKGNTPSYRLLPGKYWAKVKSTKGQAKAEQEIEVVGGKKTKIEVELPIEGQINLVVVPEAGGEPIKAFWTLKTIETDATRTPKRIASGGGPQPTYQALPGKYLAEATAKGKSITKEIEIVAGKLSREELIFNSAQ